jgi:hypothetical protein
MEAAIVAYLNEQPDNHIWGGREVATRRMLQIYDRHRGIYLGPVADNEHLFILFQGYLYELPAVNSLREFVRARVAAGGHVPFVRVRVDGEHYAVGCLSMMANLNHMDMEVAIPHDIINNLLAALEAQELADAEALELANEADMAASGGGAASKSPTKFRF